MTDHYSYWRNALEGKFGDVHENDPQPGYYRMKPHKGAEFVPAAIWIEDEKLVAGKGRGNEDTDPYEIWTYVCRYPISYEQYEKVMAGEPWPHEILPGELQTNLSNDAPENEVIADEINAIASAFDTWLKSIGGTIKTTEQSDKAATYTERVADLEKRAVSAHKVEKEPFLKGGREVDAKWKPLTERADGVKRSIKSVIGVFLVAENIRRAEEAAKVNASRPETVQAAPIKTGGSARAVSLRTRKSARITDLAAASAYSASMKNPPSDFIDVVRKLAERMLLAGVEVPGAEIIEEQVAA